MRKWQDLAGRGSKDVVLLTPHGLTSAPLDHSFVYSFYRQGVIKKKSLIMSAFIVHNTSHHVCLGTNVSPFSQKGLYVMTCSFTRQSLSSLRRYRRRWCRFSQTVTSNSQSLSAWSGHDYHRFHTFPLLRSNAHLLRVPVEL